MYSDDIKTSPIVVDIETCGLPNAAEYLEPVQPAKNLVDPAKIKADIEKRTQERDEKIALDWNVGRIAALGFWTEENGTQILLGRDEHSEATALMLCWRECRQRTIMGFNVKGFDLKFMVQRSRYLGVAHPVLDFSKYSRKGITDLYLDLTFNDGTYDQGCMRRTLHAFCRRFGIPVTDHITGAEIPTLIQAGEWDQVVAHVTSDLELTVALARKLRLIHVDEPEPTAAVVA